MSDFINSTVNTKVYNQMDDECKIIRIYDKEVLIENIKKIVEGDTNSSFLTFEIDRYQNGVDLSDKKIRFNYRNSNGKFYDVAVNVKYNDDVIRFSWLLPYSLTQPGGNVIGSIDFYGYIEHDEQYSYKTKNFKLSVEKSLGVDDKSDQSYNNWTIRIENDVESIQKKISEIEKEVESIHVPTKLSEMDDDTEHRTVSDLQIQSWNEAQKNVQVDWDEKNTNSDTYIKNKPQIPNITNDLTDELKQAYDDAVDKKHTHLNKSVLDEITQDNIESWNNKSEFDGQYSSLQGIPEDIVKCTEQTLTDEQKNQARENLGLYNERLELLETGEVTFVNYVSTSTFFVGTETDIKYIITLSNENETYKFEGNITKTQIGPYDYEYSGTFNLIGNNLPQDSSLTYNGGLLHFHTTQTIDGTYTINIYSDVTTTIPINYLPMDSELSGSSKNPVENRVITTKFNELKSDLAEKVPKTDYDPELKTDIMTQPVGKDSNGKLWTAPGSSGSGIAVTGATVGQTVKIAAVDDDGVPTAWEVVDLPEQVQTDWNQNDETAADYVKNRPFYTSDPVETVMLNNLNIDCSSGPYQGTGFTASFEEGATYTVTWDGTVYECVAYYLEEDALAVGNGSLMGASGGNSEPFVIANSEQLKILLIVDDAQSIHTVSLSGAITTTHTIEKKYLPIEIQRNAVDGEIYLDQDNKTYTFSDGLVFDSLLNKRVLLLGNICDIGTRIDDKFIVSYCSVEYSKDSSGSRIWLAANVYLLSRDGTYTFTKKCIEATHPTQ